MEVSALLVMLSDSPVTKMWHSVLVTSTKGPLFSYRMQSRERQHVANQVHRQTTAWTILTEEKLLLTCEVKGFCLHCPAFKFYLKADNYLKK